MLQLIRKIFGFESGIEVAVEYSNDNHTFIIPAEAEQLIPTSYSLCENKIEKEEVIGNFISAVIENKSKGFISYTEEAYDAVTDNRYKYIVYRNNTKKKKK